MTQENIFYNTGRTRKAQAAIEYLMTYGWMLLAVGILGTTAYNTLGAECVPSVTGFEGEALEVDDFGVSTENDYLMRVQNNDRNDIEVQEVRISSENAVGVNDTNFNVTSGETNNTIIQGGFNATQNCHDYTARVRYEVGPLTVQSAGTITAPIMVDTDIQAPEEAPQNIEITQPE